MATRTKNETNAQDRKATRPGLKAIQPEGEEPEELVTCFMTGRSVPRADAVLVKLGPGQRVWMLREFCNEERDKNRA